MNRPLTPSLSPPCGERAGRGVPIKFMVPMHTRKRKGAFHEPWGDGTGDARSANRSGTRSLRMARRTVLPFILSCPPALLEAVDLVKANASVRNRLSIGSGRFRWDPTARC